MSTNNPRKNNNNWRVAAVLLSWDIKRNGFSPLLKSEDVRTLTDEQLVDLIDVEPSKSGNRVADNILDGVYTFRKRNEESDKVWRGDIESCYAVLKQNIKCAMMMNTVKDPLLFEGWDFDAWKETAAGLRPFPNYQTCRILLESFEATTEKDQAYLYNRIMYIIDPKPVYGLDSIPIPSYRFTRKEN